MYWDSLAVSGVVVLILRLSLVVVTHSAAGSSR